VFTLCGLLGFTSRRSKHLHLALTKLFNVSTGVSYVTEQTDDGYRVTVASRFSLAALAERMGITNTRKIK
jgi:hypothetical protein